MPHKPVVRYNALTTKIRMVFDASAKPHHLANSVNDCMHTGPPLQPLLWDILIRAGMSPYVLLGDIKKAFLQASLREEDRDAFRFLFNVNGKEEHLELKLAPSCWPPRCNTTMIANRRNSRRQSRSLRKTLM